MTRSFYNSHNSQFFYNKPAKMLEDIESGAGNCIDKVAEVLLMGKGQGGLRVQNITGRKKFQITGVDPEKVMLINK